MIRFLLEKSKEPSTWKGIIWILTAFGLVFDEDQREAIAAFGMTLSGLISVFLEKGTAHTDEEIINIVKKEQDIKTEKVINESRKKRKNEEINSSDNGTDNFFDD